MIDIKYIIENKEKIKHSVKEREKEVDIDKLIKNYEIMRDKQIEIDNARRERNIFTQEVNKLKKEGKDATKLITESKKNTDKIKLLEEEYNSISNEFKILMYKVPNLLDKNVPLDKIKDRIDYESKIKKPNFDFTPKKNWEILTDLNLADFKRGIKAAGDRGWVLNGDAARLVRAITNYALDFWREKGYNDIHPPYFVNEENLYITGHYPGGEKEVYKTEDGKVFVGTGEISVLALLSGEEFSIKDLPKKIMCYTPCFRREAGSHADDKGLYRTHQFDKVELIHVTTPEKEPEEYNKLIEDEKKFYESLELPHRIITHRANDMPNKAILEKDVEVWLAGEERWGETSSIGMTTDFQARRGNIKYAGEGKRTFAHTIYASACVANRILIAILNNFQQADGSIKIPKALWKYTGFKEIKAKKAEKKDKDRKIKKKNK